MISEVRVNKPTRPALTGGVMLSIALGLVGCLSIEQMAPPVGPAFSRVAMTNGTTMSLLETGREVYLRDCSRCHSIEPINRYSLDRWRDIILRMGPESNLDESRTVALRAYVLAAHKVLAQQVATK